MFLGIDVVIFDLLCLFFNDGDHARSEPSRNYTCPFEQYKKCFWANLLASAPWYFKVANLVCYMMDMYWSLSLGFHEKSTSFSQPKKSSVLHTPKRKKKPQCPNRLITVDAVLTSCLPLRQMLINLQMSRPSSTHPWLEGCIVLYQEQVWQIVAAIEEISFDWQAAANVLWVSCFFVCTLSFFLTLLIGFLLWLMREDHHKQCCQANRESSISEVGQWTFFALQHDSRDIIRSFFLSSWENQSNQSPI